MIHWTLKMYFPWLCYQSNAFPETPTLKTNGSLENAITMVQYGNQEDLVLPSPVWGKASVAALAAYH
jgi:hypothetical protein